MNGSSINDALTHQVRTPRGLTDRARNLIQKRDRQIVALEGQVEALTAERDAARRELEACLTPGRLQQSQDQR
jgi:hypothetical protein